MFRVYRDIRLYVVISIYVVYGDKGTVHVNFLNLLKAFIDIQSVHREGIQVVEARRHRDKPTFCFVYIEKEPVFQRFVQGF